MVRARAGVVGAVAYLFLFAAGVAGLVGVERSAVAQSPAPLPALSPAAVASGTGLTTVHGIEFSIIGSPGNPEAPPEFQSRFTPTPRLGSVSTEYGLARAELTNTQYLEFVRAYAPHFDVFDSVEFLGLGIRSNGDPRNPDSYFIRPGRENAAAEMGWRFAARYCNWLHNDKRGTPDSFLTGAYDATTFTPDPPAGTPNDVTQRLPGAKFFIPTQAEWTKGMYFDPNRFGPGQPGYWANPITSDAYVIPGLPENGGQSNVGINNGVLPFPILQYPTVMSPWGLFDGSGGEEEWLENSLPFGERLFRSTSQFGGSFFDDHIRVSRTDATDLRITIGLRVGVAIPTPPLALLGVGLLVVGLRRAR
jgi:hypothetical protein